jgi:hypothetical protein
VLLGSSWYLEIMSPEISSKQLRTLYCGRNRGSSVTTEPHVL